MKSLNFQLKMIVLNFEDEDCYNCISIQTIFITSLMDFEKLSIKVDSSFLAYVPKDEIALSEDENQKVEKLLEFLMI